jgi:L-fuconolactonase
MEIIDGYLHCGLRKFEPIERVRRTLAQAGTNRAVLAQHLGEFDNSYIGGIAAAEPSVFAGVGLVDHTDPQAGLSLAHLARRPGMRGVRLTLAALAEAPGLWAEAVSLGLTLVLYAPQGIANQPDTLGRFLEAQTAARVVLTHLGNPDPSEAPLFEKHKAVLELARFPGLFYQVSGMKMFCPSPHEPLYPLIEMATERLGPSRLIWGSNYPVVGDASDYRRDLALLLEGRLPIPAEAIADVAGANARRLWFEPSRYTDSQK